MRKFTGKWSAWPVLIGLLAAPATFAQTTDQLTDAQIEKYDIEGYTVRDTLYSPKIEAVIGLKTERTEQGDVYASVQHSRSNVEFQFVCSERGGHIFDIHSRPEVAGIPAAEIKNRLLAKYGNPTFEKVDHSVYAETPDVIIMYWSPQRDPFRAEYDDSHYLHGLRATLQVDKANGNAVSLELHLSSVQGMRQAEQCVADRRKRAIDERKKDLPF